MIVGPYRRSIATASADAGITMPRDVLQKFFTLACVASFSISLAVSKVFFLT